MLDLDKMENENNKAVDSETKAYQALEKILDSIIKGATINKVPSEDSNCVIFNISKVEPGVIIGKHGHTLDAIQYIINLIANKGINKEEQKLYIIDIDDYRKRREESLKKYAIEKAELVKKNHNEIALYSMNTIERRLVHLALQEDPDVTTFSEGREPYRRIIISPVIKTTPKNRNYEKDQNESI